MVYFFEPLEKPSKFAIGRSPYKGSPSHYAREANYITMGRPYQHMPFKQHSERENGHIFEIQLAIRDVERRGVYLRHATTSNGICTINITIIIATFTSKVS